MQERLRSALLLHLNGQRRQAEALYRSMLQQDPACADAAHLLGRILRESDDVTRAIEWLKRAVTLRPRQLAYRCSLGEALHATGDIAGAISEYEEALVLSARSFEAWYNLGLARSQQAQHDKAESAFGSAARLRPHHVDSHYQQGNALIKLGRFAGAVDCFRRVLELQPDHHGGLQMLGTALLATGQSQEAVRCLEQAIELHADFAACSNLGGALMRIGRVADAAVPFRAAIALNPGFAAGFSNLLFCLMHDSAVTPEQCWAEHQAFAARYEAPLLPAWRAHPNPPIVDRRLKLGFVSGDLRDHSMANFVAPVWALLDADQFELFVYSSHADMDAVTHRLRSLAQHWRQVSAMNDEDLAALIREDAIDILIDLSGHTAFNRLLTFARKPAPVQATWIGYPGTTGLTAMDYVICDRYNAPQGLYEHFCSEKFARIPSATAFNPVVAPDVAELPALGVGHICFGSFHRPAKLSDRVIAVWSELLNQVPRSRILLGYVSNEELAQRLRSSFARHGVGGDRIQFQAETDLTAYLALHARVDILLDAWPYSGGTTNNHAVWMGVPVVSLRGQSRAHCQGAAVMDRMGLSDWVADGIEPYVRIGIEKSRDLQALAELRRGMRARWQEAPLRQDRTVVAGLQKALRTMWGRWCSGRAPDHFEVPLHDGPG